MLKIYKDGELLPHVKESLKTSDNGFIEQNEKDKPVSLYNVEEKKGSLQNG